MKNRIFSRLMIPALALSAGIAMGSRGADEQPELSSKTELRERAKATARAIADEAARRGIPMEAWTLSGERAWLSGFDNGRPMYDAPFGLSSAISINAHRVHEYYPGVVMEGDLIVGVWDGGPVRPDHPELEGRVVNFFDDPEEDASNHATAVAGVIATSGLDPAARGLLPAIHVHAYHLSDDLEDMIERAAADPTLPEPANVLVSNHSYGNFVGWSQARIEIEPEVFWQGWYWFGDWPEREDRRFGQYTERARDWDALCHAAPYYLPVRAAGNDRTEGFLNNGNSFRYWDPETETWTLKSFNSATDPYPDNWKQGGFNTIGTFANAKNILTVGALTFAVSSGDRLAESARMTNFSSWGPSDDGRVKPDLVAVGDDVMVLWGTPPSLYASGSGTSFAAPAASGSAMLLQAMHHQATGSPLFSSTVKALLIHTATDIGNPGPDYLHGWGLIDALAAADTLNDHLHDPAAGILHVEMLGNQDTFTHTFQWNGHSPISATLCWTDPPGPIIEGLNDPTPVLINDLDLRILAPDGETVHFPFLLDVGNFTAIATTGDNLVDNVEKIIVESPVEGDYTLTVSHKGELEGSEQRFSLVLSGQVLPGLNIEPLNEHSVTHLIGQDSAQFTWQLRNSSSEALPWVVNDVPNWLVFETDSGELEPGESITVVASLVPNAPDFTPGSHEARLRFSDSAGGNQRSSDIMVDVWRAIAPVFHDDFESGELLDRWRVTGTGQHQALVREDLGPIDQWHLVLDDYMLGAARSRIEVTSLLSIAGWSDLYLDFDAKTFHTPTLGPHANPYLGGASTTGVALSADGHLWHEVHALRGGNISLQYQPRGFDLQAAIDSVGLTGLDQVYLRFSTFVRNPADATTNQAGLAIDNIIITGIPKLGDNWAIY